MVTPSPTTYAAKEKLIFPRRKILREFVGDLMGLPEDHPAVARGCMTLMAPICILIVGDRRIMKRALPSFGLEPRTLRPWHGIWSTMPWPAWKRPPARRQKGIESPLVRKP